MPVMFYLLSIYNTVVLFLLLNFVIVCPFDSHASTEIMMFSHQCLPYVLVPSFLIFQVIFAVILDTAGDQRWEEFVNCVLHKWCIAEGVGF